MNTVRISRFLFNVLIQTGIYFTVRLAFDLVLQDEIKYGSILVWSLMMGIFFTITLKPSIKLIRKVLVLMHGEEKVKANEEAATRREF